MSFYKIALKDMKSFIKNPYIIPPLLLVHYLQFIISINVFENFIGQNSNSSSFAVIEIINNGKSSNVIIFYAGFILTQLITLTSIVIASFMATEWENKTYQRILASPVSLLKVNIATFSGYIAVILIISIIFIFLTYITYGFSWGSAYFNVLIITAFYAFTCVAFAMFICNAFKQTKLVAGVSTFTSIGLIFLSGGLFAGAAFNKISKYTIVRWTFDAYTAVIEGKPLISVLPNICYILITGILLMILYILVVLKGGRYE